MKHLVLAFLFLIPLQSFAVVEIQFIDLAYSDHIQNEDIEKVVNKLKELSHQNKLEYMLPRSRGAGMSFEMCVVPSTEDDVIVQELKSIELNPKQSKLNVWSTPFEACHGEE